MPTTINGIPLHVSTIGNPALPRIVFLHGFLGSGSDWLPVTRELQSDYCCMMIDLPGHGSANLLETIPPEDFFIQTVDALADLLRQSIETPCSLVGYSMGGRIALALLLRHPELFSKAVIISASPGIKTEKERFDRQEHDEKVARKIERSFDSFIEAWYEQPLFATLKSHPIFKEVESERKINDPQNLALALRLLGTGRQPSFWEELKNNKVPVSFFTGEKDERYVEIGHQMVKLTPESDLEIFPHCGHTLHLENRVLFLDRLKNFFNQQE
ncbi:MAG: 2-succinyl-6-hydroxy-2,4-cyclohexadiene-1-carboxylate synthase [Chlorobiaceae bacterium]